jgi:ADP-ribosyl-[dinitrogen reductase] hydrolase
MAETRSLQDRMLGALWGAIVGDALGVPVEFSSRAERKRDPVTDMRGFGTHHQPPGTWSDDSSLILCTVDSLINHEFDTHDMGQRFVRWYREGLWTPWGKVFDIGGTTRCAIGRLEKGVDPELAGDDDENSNGNGSLMRILPIALRFASSDRGHSSRPGASGGVSPQSLPSDQLLDRAHRVSSLTHRHPRSQIACGFYCLMAAALLKGATPVDAYRTAVDIGLKMYAAPPFLREMAPFRKFVSGKIHELLESDIQSSGYVVDTLEASVWCLLTSSSYEEAVLKAVNLGEDTDTTGCVAGGLAGIGYGVSAIPQAWLSQIACAQDLQAVLDKFMARISG